MPFLLLVILMTGCKVQYVVEVTWYNCDFCSTTLVNKAVVSAFFLFFVHKYIFLPEEDELAFHPQACSIAVNRAKSYYSYNITENWKQ